jgi:F0F1-type ATP synthase delta subunit
VSAQESKTEEEQQKILVKLSAILKKQKKEHLLPEILERAGKFLQRKKRVELFFGKEHSRESTAGVKNRLLKFFGDDKEIEIKVDKDLVGGFRAKSEKFLIKASIKDFLNELKSNY